MGNRQHLGRHRAPRPWRVAVILFALAAVGGCQAPRTEPIRAVWVTRWDYRTAEDVKQIVADCDSLGLNAIVFQVRGNGTVFYPSRIEPWAEEFGYTDPGFDPLAVAIEEAHQRGMELHAWLNVMPAWRGKRPPEDPRQLVHTHPEWLLVDQQGRRQPLTGHYVILNPCLPEVRAYLTDVSREICANYEVDGLHMDYIRFVTHGSEAGADYPHDEKTLTLFKEATGQTPASDPEAWDDWRRDAVTQLVADIRDMMRQVRPDAELSASVFGNREMVKARLFQDGAKWLAEDLIDIAFPMVYTASRDDFIRWTEDYRAHSNGKPIVPGIGLHKHDDDDTSIEQIELAHAWGDGFCFFSYGAFFPRARDGQGTPSPRLERANERRRLRRENLKPVLLAPPAGQEGASTAGTGG